MIDDVIKYLRKGAEKHRVVFTKVAGGRNAELFDRWANEVESLRARVKALEAVRDAARELILGYEFNDYALLSDILVLKQALDARDKP